MGDVVNLFKPLLLLEFLKLCILFAASLGVILKAPEILRYIALSIG